MNQHAKHVMGRLIRQHRHLQKLTQRALAKRLRMPSATVSAWETYKTFPDGISILYVEMALGLADGQLVKEWKDAMRGHGWLPKILTGVALLSLVTVPAPASVPDRGWHDDNPPALVALCPTRGIMSSWWPRWLMRLFWSPRSGTALAWA